MTNHNLTVRQLEVLQQVAYGRSNTEIAFDLGVSEQTVKNHMTAVMRKLNVNNRIDAIREGVKKQVILFP